MRRISIVVSPSKGNGTDNSTARCRPLAGAGLTVRGAMFANYRDFVKRGWNYWKYYEFFAFSSE